MKINFNIPTSFNKKDNLEQRNINPPKDLPALTKNESEMILLTKVMITPEVKVPIPANQVVYLILEVNC
jgi:hypothetical protein